MSCEEMIYSNDYADYMINYFDTEETDNVYQDSCVNSIVDKIAILHQPRTQGYMTNLEKTPYSFIPKLFGLMDSGNMEAIGVKQVKNSTGLDGENVIVGIIDTGIDYNNNLFRNIDGSTRIGVIWDQSLGWFGKSDEKAKSNVIVNDVPNPYYGTTYSRSEINAALVQDNSYDIVPALDENGHGTFMAGIAAGGENRENDFLGIANRAEIAVVKLKEAKSYLKDFFGVPQNNIAYQETDIIYAIEYLLRYADMRNLPISIMLGVGSSNGGHRGLTFLERYMTSVLENPGVLISVPAGNEGNERLHYAGELNEEKNEIVEFNVAEGQNAIVLEFWGNAPSTFAVGLVSPQGDQIERIPPRFGEEEELRLPFSGSEIYIAYQLVETYSGDELIFLRIINPTPGLWQLLIYSEDEGRSLFNIWMPLRQFLQKDTYFLISDPENTITIPGNASLVATMTAYNHINGSIFANAGRGFINTIALKPDLTAPGVLVTGPGLRNNFVTRSGTSVAAAHAAGVFALFLQWNLENPELGPYYAAQVLSFFYRSAEREIRMEYPNVIWGYGIINIMRVFEQFRLIEI